MPKNESQSNESQSPEKDQILSALEPDQLAAAKHHFSRRVLKGPEALLVWSLRLYLLFMIVVVIYQIWIGAR